MHSDHEGIHLLFFFFLPFFENGVVFYWHGDIISRYGFIFFLDLGRPEMLLSIRQPSMTKGKKQINDIVWTEESARVLSLRVKCDPRAAAVRAITFPHIQLCVPSRTHVLLFSRCRAILALCRIAPLIGTSHTCISYTVQFCPPCNCKPLGSRSLVNTLVYRIHWIVINPAQVRSTW